ncbi:hypothetical protein L484_018778 [Morus notabilis]|uniref:Uncharacterized protein n=1 Tax=Morus notabilis TaxID=981085 RepID=W9R4B5_9ROSA|nr:hypothetical protein L484_018778 [Morus notabilis]
MRGRTNATFITIENNNKHKTREQSPLQSADTGSLNTSHPGVLVTQVRPPTTGAITASPQPNPRQGQKALRPPSHSGTNPTTTSGIE